MKKILKYWYLIIFGIVLILCLFIDNKDDLANDYNNVTYEEKEVEEIISYYVDIKGEVKSPGVYEIENNKRIIDVINIAGGLTNNADVSLLNLSKKVTDEMNIKIYSKKEVSDAAKRLNEPTIIEIIKEVEKECMCPDVNDACDKVIPVQSIENNKENSIEFNENNNTKVNINTATKEDLMNINGLGEAKADNIIKYRETNKFKRIEDILNVSGIGDALFEKIKVYIEI